MNITLKMKAQKVVGNLRRNFESEHVDRKATILAWKDLNIKNLRIYKL